MRRTGLVLALRALARAPAQLSSGHVSAGKGRRSRTEHLQEI